MMTKFRPCFSIYLRLSYCNYFSSNCAGIINSSRGREEEQFPCFCPSACSLPSPFLPTSIPAISVAMQRDRERERDRDPSLRKVFMRVYKSDADVRGACNAVGAAFVVGFGSTIGWDILSMSYFATFGVVLLAALYHARKASHNPVINCQAAFLGFIMGTAILKGGISGHPHYMIFSLYVFMLCFFHFTEFIMTAFINRRALQPDSFLLNHSVAYWVAAASSWVEFWTEAYFFPLSKTRFLLHIGLVITLGGECLRKLAMVHAGSGFTHRLAMTKRPDHRLCTSGVYSYFRHPGYVGWFAWCIGTQVMLGNPICTLVYAAVSWKFFSDRIIDEERDLLHFFGEEYREYQSEVPTGIPFVEGCVA
ncbi:hypothetical protein PRIPAC_70145 [Pristionchus pacificus]|uniref:Protein-S-isoprenylcysteine O-methyltransferase n=1 Tax=Pristionchus pacificus TaxID=54126 RepID=A0A2A6B4S5_PRIPA|nr:hypothetical protein PRIPAC_70145 [Pristionchus pacificus]|eukprot:PDM60861.1 hypothetical protein PRIPAC_54667 [Pristionchus pacificus]